MSKIIIGLTGRMVAGKGTAAAYIKEKYGAGIYGFSGPLRDVLNRLYIPLERANIAKMSTILREGFGQNLTSRTLAHDIMKDDNQIIILDGVRRPNDVATFKDMPGFVLVSIEAEQKLRYERLTKRRQNADDATKTFEDFCKDEEAEADILVPVVMKDADIIIDNNGDLNSFYGQIDQLLNNLQNK